MKIQNCSITINGDTIRYKKSGSGAPLILVHGLSASTYWWKKNIESLSEKYEVFLVDLPGFGDMRTYRTRIVLNDAAAWLIAWMDAVSIPRADFIGHSMGGYICMQLALLSPERAQRLILVSPAGLGMKKAYMYHLFSLFRAIPYTPIHFIPILIRDALYAGPITLIRTSREITAMSSMYDIQNLTVPVLLIWGKNDKLVSPEIGIMIKELLPRATLQIIPNAGHVPMFDQPGEFDKVVLAFLADNKKR